MRTTMIAMVALIATNVASSGQTGVPGTVNAASQGEVAQAKAAIMHAGYQPGVLEFAQDHNLFFTASKGGETCEITITPDRKLYISTAIPAADRRS